MVFFYWLLVFLFVLEYSGCLEVLLVLVLNFGVLVMGVEGRVSLFGGCRGELDYCV